MRRNLLLVMLALIAAPHNASANNELSLLDVGQQLESAAKAIGQFADSINKLVESGVATYDILAARRARMRLFDYSAQASRVYGANRAFILSTIDNYLASPSEHKWAIVQDRISWSLGIIKELLRDLESDRNDFVEEDSYRDLGLALRQRGLMMEKILTLPPPLSADELKALRTIRDKYAQLVLKLGEAETALNLYIKSSSKNTNPK